MEMTAEAVCEGCQKVFDYHPFRFEQDASRGVRSGQAYLQCLECRHAEQARREEEREQERQVLLKAKRTELFYEWLEVSGIPLRYQDSVFEKFERKLQPEAFETAKKFAEAMTSGGIYEADARALMLASQGNGTGKTHLATAIGRAYLASEARTWEFGSRRCPVLFTTIPRMMLRIRATYRDDSAESEQDVIDDLSTVSLLILDDVGKEKPSDHTRQTYFTIIDARYGAEMPMIITSNLILPKQAKQLADVMGEASMSRLKEMSERWRVVMDGPDYRFRDKPAGVTA